MSKEKEPYRIDVHHHIIPPDYVSKLQGIGINGGIGVPFPQWSPQKALDLMDKNGIAVGMTSISTPGVYFKDNSFSRDLTRRCNEFSARLIGDHPNRFGAFASLPLPDVDGALRELEYALDTLKLDGVVLLSNVEGHYLGNPEFDELFDELNRRKAVVFLHPSDPPYGQIEGIKFANALVEAPFETTRTVANLIHSGTLDRCPDVNIILSHAGGTIPFLAWRIALIQYKTLHKTLRWQAIYDFLLTKRGPHEGIKQLQRLYYDTAFAANPYALRALQELVDPQHVLFGTDSGWAAGWEIPVMLKGLCGYSGFDEKALALIERENALRLFPSFAQQLAQGNSH